MGIGTPVNLVRRALKCKAHKPLVDISAIWSTKEMDCTPNSLHATQTELEPAKCNLVIAIVRTFKPWFKIPADMLRIGQYVSHISPTNMKK